MPSTPKHPEVPLDVWRPAIEATRAFHALAPWRWMSDGDVSVVVDPAGSPWFASVLGAADEVYGLVLYRGSAGLRFMQRLSACPDPESLRDLMYQQEALTVWFGTKNELTPAQKKVFAALGYQPAKGARQAWPSILDHKPGYAPWGPDAESVAWLAKAIPAIMRFALLLKEHSELAGGRGRMEYPLIPTGEEVLHADRLEWRKWLEESEPRLEAPTIGVTDPDVEARLRKLPVAQSRKVDVGWFFLPDSIAEGDRPYWGRIIAILDSETAEALTMNVLSIKDVLGTKAGNLFIDMVLQQGRVPSVVRFRDEVLARQFTPLLESLGCRVECADRLPALSAFREAMETFARG